jgi:hypothetical protein
LKTVVPGATSIVTPEGRKVMVGTPEGYQSVGA